MDLLRRRRRAADNSKDSKPDVDDHKSAEDVSKVRKLKNNRSDSSKVRWRCVDTCCWLIGNVCFLYFLFFGIYHLTPRTQLENLNRKLNEALGSKFEESPGNLLYEEGLRMKHPIVFVPGIVTGGLELWQGRACAAGLFRKKLWGGTFGEVYKRPFCWMDHMILDNETGLDPPDVKLRPVAGLVAADYFMPGYFVWAVIIEQLARLGYEERSMHMASYDWRLSYLNTEKRDKSLSRLKATIEVLVQTNDNEKVVVVPHSMGSLYFLFFLKWVEAPAPYGGGGGPTWVNNHIHAVLNIAGPLLGVPKAFTGLFSAEAKDIAMAREIAPVMLDNLQTLQHVMRVSRTWDATMSMLPKGGNTIWGGVDWSPEQGYDCSVDGNRTAHTDEVEVEDPEAVPRVSAHYGRMVAFGRNASLMPGEDLPEPVAYSELKEGADSHFPSKGRDITCGDVWTEYQELSWHTIQEVAKRGLFTADDLPDLLRKVAPKLMGRVDQNWGLGIADNLKDPKYAEEHKYWSNPLETTLPNAPDMEVLCMYGVGILTERAYIYKLSPYNDTCLIPFRIDASVAVSKEEEDVGCLKDGVYFVDGDETVPALSAGMPCAKIWKGKNRFNPGGSKTYVREYDHKPPATLLDGRGTHSASHVDIMGNFALIEDIARIATGASGEDIGGNRIYSKLLEWAKRINLKM